MLRLLNIVSLSLLCSSLLPVHAFSLLQPPHASSSPVKSFDVMHDQHRWSSTSISNSRKGQTSLTHSPSSNEETQKKARLLQKLLLHSRGGGEKIDLFPPFVEAVGTATLTGTIAMIGSSSLGLPIGAKALGVAATVLAITFAGYPYSGAHYNPVITSSLFLQGKVGFGRAFGYILSQVIGGVAGAFFAKNIISPGGLPSPSFSFTRATALIEMFFSFALVQTMSQTTANKDQQKKYLFAPAVATLVGLATVFGANLNPAVSFGLTAVTGQDKGALALWGLPLLAAIPASMITRFTDADEASADQPHQSILPKVPTNWARSGGKFVNEYVGTFFLSGIVSLALATGKIATPIAAGFMLLIQLWAGGYISGGHLNPAVTLGIFLRNGGETNNVIGYILSQLAGAVTAAAAVGYAYGANAVVGTGLPKLASGITEGQVFGAEALFAGLLLQAYLHLNSPGGSLQLGNFSIAATLLAGLAAVAAVSGGTLNPAIALGNYLKNGLNKPKGLLLLYVLGPIVGTTLSALLNKVGSENKDEFPDFSISKP